MGLWYQASWAQLPSPTNTSCLTLGSISLSIKWESQPSKLIEMLCGLSEKMQAQHLSSCKHRRNVGCSDRHFLYVHLCPSEELCGSSEHRLQLHREETTTADCSCSVTALLCLQDETEIIWRCLVTTFCRTTVIITSIVIIPSYIEGEACM